MMKKIQKARPGFFRCGQKVRYRPEYRVGENTNTVFTVNIDTHEGLFFKERTARFNRVFFEVVS